MSATGVFSFFINYCRALLRSPSFDAIAVPLCVSQRAARPRDTPGCAVPIAAARGVAADVLG